MKRFSIILALLTIGLSQAAVHFSKSSLYDVYDFVGTTEVRLAPCDNGCLIFASTVGHGYPNPSSKFDPYASNLMISRDGGQTGTNITALSFDYGITQEKRPLIIPRSASVSVFNRNGPNDKVFSLVLYVVAKEVADDIDAQYEIYDALHLDRGMMSPQTITTVMSAVPFTITVKGEEGKKNFATARLTGFDNALDKYGDECAIAYQTPSTAATFPDLELYATVPIVSLTFSEIGKYVKIGANTKFYETVEFYNDGFISSAGWNGCRKPKSGGFQSFRSPAYITSNAYMLMTNDDYFTMYLEGDFHTDENHTLTVRDLTNWKDEYWCGSYEEGTSKKELTIDKTYFCEFKSREMEGDQGFIVRHYGKRLAEGGETTTTSVPPSKSSDAYCKCDVDKFGMPSDWSSTDIWLDVVIVLDTSEALSQQSLQNAGSFIESLLGDDTFDVLTTDHKKPYYTRVGVIAMADVPEILYDLNMTKKDSVRDRVSIKKGLSGIDFNAAYNAAQSMLSNGLVSEPSRASTRQVIHFITNSQPGQDVSKITQFKTSGGVIVVNEVANEGEKLKNGLKSLASDGYFFSDVSDYMKNVQALCKANCFCTNSRVPFTGPRSDPALQAGGGCYSASVAGVSYSKAKQSCADTRGGIIATVHNDEKGAFLHKLITEAVPRQYFYWIGYAKGVDNVWIWEDQVTDSCTNWGVGEPSSSTVAKCAYVDQSVSSLPWGAGNCQTGFPYACEYAPCSAGNKNC